MFRLVRRKKKSTKLSSATKSVQEGEYNSSAATDSSVNSSGSEYIAPASDIVDESATQQQQQPSSSPLPYSPNHVLVNHTRAKHGLEKFARSRFLDQVAQETAEHLSRQGRLEGTPRERLLLKLKAQDRHIGENVTCGRSIQTIHRFCLKSESNLKKNILCSKYNEMGVGTSKDSDGSLYLVQYFRYNPELEKSS